MPSWDSARRYKANLQRFADVAAFYTQYKDMVEFQFGLFNNADLSMINSVTDAIQMLKDSRVSASGHRIPQIVSKAQIYGMEISTNGMYTFNKTPNCSITWDMYIPNRGMAELQETQCPGEHLYRPASDEGEKQ